MIKLAVCSIENITPEENFNQVNKVLSGYEADVYLFPMGTFMDELSKYKDKVRELTKEKTVIIGGLEWDEGNEKPFDRQYIFKDEKVLGIHDNTLPDDPASMETGKENGIEVYELEINSQKIALAPLLGLEAGGGQTNPDGSFLNYETYDKLIEKTKLPVIAAFGYFALPTVREAPRADLEKLSENPDQKYKQVKAVMGCQFANEWPLGNYKIGGGKCPLAVRNENGKLEIQTTDLMKKEVLIRKI